MGEEERGVREGEERRGRREERRREGEEREKALFTWLLAVDGSPSISIFTSPRRWVPFAKFFSEPPRSIKRRATCQIRGRVCQIRASRDQIRVSQGKREGEREGERR